MWNLRTGYEKGYSIAKRVVAAVFAFCFVSASSAAEVVQNQKPAQKRVIRIAAGGDPHQLDPALADDEADLLLLRNLTEPLLARNPQTGLWMPGAAEKVEVLEKGKKLRFTLRNHLRWSDGNKIQAKDFAYALTRILDPKTDSWLAEGLRAIKNAEDFAEGALMDPRHLGIVTPAENVLVISLSRPSTSIFDWLCQPGTSPVRQELVERFKEKWSEPENWLGSGPYTIKNKGAITVLSKNPFYRGAREIAADEVHVYWVQNQSEGVRLYLDGKVDQFGHRDFAVPASEFQNLKGRKDFILQPDLRTVFLRVNTQNAPFSQTLLREALAMSIDRDLLLSSFGRAGEVGTFSLVPEGLKGYLPPRGYLFNVVGAKRALRDYGYCAAGQNTDCKRFPPFEIIHIDHPMNHKIALGILAIWKRELGIDLVKTVAVSEEEFEKKVRTGDFSVAMDQMGVNPERPFGFLDAFRTGNLNAKGFTHPGLGKLLDLAETETDWGEAKRYFRRAEALILREGGVIPLYHTTTPLLVSKKLKGFAPNIWDEHPFAELSVSE